MDANAYTDRRIAGSILGTSVLGSLGFIVFSGTASFGLGGCKNEERVSNINIIGALGVVIGGIIGSRIRKKIDLTKLSIDQLYCFQVTQVIKWSLKNSKKLQNLSFPILIYKVSVP